MLRIKCDNQTLACKDKKKGLAHWGHLKSGYKPPSTCTTKALLTMKVTVSYQRRTRNVDDLLRILPEAIINLLFCKVEGINPESKWWFCWLFIKGVRPKTEKRQDFRKATSVWHSGRMGFNKGNQARWTCWTSVCQTKTGYGPHCPG